MTRKDGVDNLRDHRIFIADDAWKQRLAPLEFAYEVVSKLVFDTTAGEAVFGKSTLAQSA
jgi:hypothetical protein